MVELVGQPGLSDRVASSASVTFPSGIASATAPCEQAYYHSVGWVAYWLVTLEFRDHERAHGRGSTREVAATTVSQLRSIVERA